MIFLGDKNDYSLNFKIVWLRHNGDYRSSPKNGELWKAETDTLFIDELQSNGTL